MLAGDAPQLLFHDVEYESYSLDANDHLHYDGVLNGNEEANCEKYDGL